MKVYQLYQQESKNPQSRFLKAQIKKQDSDQVLIDQVFYEQFCQIQIKFFLKGKNITMIMIFITLIRVLIYVFVDLVYLRPLLGILPPRIKSIPIHSNLCSINIIIQYKYQYYLYYTFLIAYNQCMQSQKIYPFSLQSVVNLLLATFDSNTVKQSARQIEEFSGYQQFVGYVLDIVKDGRIDKRIRQAALITLSNIIKTHNKKADIISVQQIKFDKQKDNSLQIIKIIKQNIVSIAYQSTNYSQIPLIANIIEKLTRKLSNNEFKQIVQQIKACVCPHNQAICQDSFSGRYYRQFVYLCLIEELVQQYNSCITEFYKNIIIVSITLTQMIQILTADMNRIRQCIQTPNTKISVIIKNINSGLRVMLLIFKKLNKLYEIIKKCIHELLLILLFMLDNIDRIIQRFNQQCSANANQAQELLHLNLNIVYRFYQFCYHDESDIKQQSTLDQNAETLSRIVQSQYSKLVIVNIGKIILSDINLHIKICNPISICNDITKCMYWITQVHAQTKSLILANSINILIALLKNYTIDQCEQMCQIAYRVEIDESRQGLIELIGTFLQQQDNKTIVQQIIRTISMQTNNNIQNIQLSMYIISRFKYNRINIREIIQKNIVVIIGLKIDSNSTHYPQLLGLLKIRACEIVSQYMNQIQQVGAVSEMYQLFLSNAIAILDQTLTKNNIHLLPILLSFTSVLLSIAKIMKPNIQKDENNLHKQLLVKLISTLPLLQHSDSYRRVLDTLEDFVTCLPYGCVRQVLGYVFNSIFKIYWAQIQQIHERLTNPSQKISKLTDSHVEDTKELHEQCIDILTEIIHMILIQSKNNKSSTQINFNLKWIVQLLAILDHKSRIQIILQCGQVQSYTFLYNQAVHLLLLACIFDGNVNNVKQFHVHNILPLCYNAIKQSGQTVNNVESNQVEQIHEQILGQGQQEEQQNELGQEFIFDGMEQQAQTKIIPHKPISDKLIVTILTTISNTMLLKYLLEKQQNLTDKCLQLSSSFISHIFCSDSLTLNSCINANYNYQQKKICLDTIKIFIWTQIFSSNMVCSIFQWALQSALGDESKKHQIQQYYLPIIYLSVIRYKITMDASKLCRVLQSKLKSSNQTSKYHQKWLIQCSTVVIKMLFGSNSDDCKGIAIEIAQNIQIFLSNRINRDKSQSNQQDLYSMAMSPTKNIQKYRKNTNYFTSQMLQQIIGSDQALFKYFTETLIQIKHALNNYR